MICDELFGAGRAIEEYVRLGWYGEPEGPLHQTFARLLDHMRAVQCQLDRDNYTEFDEIAREFGVVSSNGMAEYVARIADPLKV
jgi:hypothetical protein